MIQLREYSFQEAENAIEQLQKQAKELDSHIKELTAKRNSIRAFDRKGKRVLDEKISEARKLHTYYGLAVLMFMMYEDSITGNTRSALSKEELIKSEKRAEDGDLMSSFMVFFHRCFMDRNILERDIRKMEKELEEGNYYWEPILWCYKNYFEVR